MFKFRKNPFSASKKGCGTQLETVLDGANSKIFTKQKAALAALDQLYEERCTADLIHIMIEFSQSDDLFKQHLAKKARDYLKRTQS